MEHPLRLLRASTVPLEVAHRGVDGLMHGHSLVAEVWTEADVDLDDWCAVLRRATTAMEGQLETTIGARTFEDVAAAILAAVPAACRVVLRLPTRGHCVDLSR